MITQYASAYLTITVESEVKTLTISPPIQTIHCDADGENPQYDRLEFTVTAKIGERRVLPFINNNKLQEPFEVSGVSFYISEVNDNTDDPYIVLKIADLVDSSIERLTYLCDFNVLYKNTSTSLKQLGTANLILYKNYNGAEYAFVDLTNSTMTIACDINGVPKLNELGINSLNTCNASVFYAAQPLKFTKSNTPNSEEFTIKIEGVNCTPNFTDTDNPYVVKLYLEQLYADKAKINIEFITNGNINDPVNALNYKRSININTIRDSKKPNVLKKAYKEAAYPGVAPSTPLATNLNQELGNYWSDVKYTPTYEYNALWESEAIFDGDTGDILKSWSIPVAIVLPPPKNVSASLYGKYNPETQYLIRSNVRSIIYVLDSNNRKVYYYSKVYGELDFNLRNSDKGTVTFPFSIPTFLSGGDYVEIPLNLDPIATKVEWSKYWSLFQSQYESIATGLLLAETAYIGNLTSAGITIGDPDVTNGWELNNSSITARSGLTILTTEGKIIAEEANISGVITATSGRFLGNVTVGNAGINGTSDDINPIRFFAGDNYTNRKTAPFRVYDNGDIVTNNMSAVDTTLTGQIKGTGFAINEIYAEFNEIRAKKISIADGIFENGQIGKWKITSNGFSSGIAADSVTRESEMVVSNAPVEVSGDVKLNTGVPFDTFIDFATITAPNSITIPNTYPNYNVQFPSLTFNGYNDLAKDGRKYSQFEFKAVLNYTIENTIYTLESNTLIISGQDTASENAFFQLYFSPLLVQNIKKDSIISNIKYSIKYTKKRISDNSTGSGRGRLHTLNYLLSGNTSKIKLDVFPISKTATLNPDKFEIKKSETEKFCVSYYTTTNGTEKLRVDILGDLNIIGDLSATATKALDSDKLGGKLPSAYYLSTGGTITGNVVVNGNLEVSESVDIKNILRLDGGTLVVKRPDITTGWVRGLEYGNLDDTALGGFGLYGEGSQLNRMVFGFGKTFWINSAINILPDNKVGILTSNPSEAFEVNGNIKASNFLIGENSVYHSGNANLPTVDWYARNGFFSGSVAINNNEALKCKNTNGLNVNILYAGGDNRLYFGSGNGLNDIIFMAGGTQKAVLLNNGNFAIGRDNAIEKFEVDGNIRSHGNYFQLGDNSNGSESKPVNRLIGFKGTFHENDYAQIIMPEHSQSQAYGELVFTLRPLDAATGNVAPAEVARMHPSRFTYKGDIISENNIKAKSGEFNDLKVFGNLDVFELTANQTRVTNGDLWIQNSCKVAAISVASDGSLIIETDEPMLQNNDLCIIQVRRSSGSVVRFSFKVVSNELGPTKLFCSTITGSHTDIIAGDLIVQVGNTTNTARQSSVLNCVSFGGYGAATLYYANVDTIPVGSFYPDNSKITSAIGDLKALNLGSAAIATSDGHFKGTLEATGGKIANFTISENSINARNILLSDSRIPTLPELAVNSVLVKDPIADQQIGEGSPNPTFSISRNINVTIDSTFISDWEEAYNTGAANAAIYVSPDSPSLKFYVNYAKYNIYKTDSTYKNRILITSLNLYQLPSSDLKLDNIKIPLAKGYYTVSLEVSVRMEDGLGKLVLEMAGYELRPFQAMNYLGNNGMMAYFGQQNYMRFASDDDIVFRKGGILFKINTSGIYKGLADLGDPNNITWTAL